VDSKAEYYLAHVARKKETKTNNASAPLIQYRFRSVILHFKVYLLCRYVRNQKINGEL